MAEVSRLFITFIRQWQSTFTSNLCPYVSFIVRKSNEQVAQKKTWYEEMKPQMKKKFLDLPDFQLRRLDVFHTWQLCDLNHQHYLLHDYFHESHWHMLMYYALQYAVQSLVSFSIKQPQYDCKEPSERKKKFHTKKGETNKEHYNHFNLSIWMKFASWANEIVTKMTFDDAYYGC